MFGAYYLGWPLADSPNVVIVPPTPPVPPTITYQTLVVPCRTRLCADISGIGPRSDLTLYNLQEAIYFNESPISILADCPAGHYCPAGTFPKVFTYPIGRFTIPVVNNGDSILLQLQGCMSIVSTVLSANATDSEIQAEADSIILEVAQQQAQCDALASVV